MSLVYVIDGYNVIKHPFFARAIRRDKGAADPSVRSAAERVHPGAHSARSDFLRYLQTKRLTGSTRNRVVVVFDGYPEGSFEREVAPVEVLFSCDDSADDLIRRLVEKAASPKETIVVSDDRQVQFFARSAGVMVIGVEEFVGRRPAVKPGTPVEPQETKLSYTQMERINKELREKWLK